jgi:YqjK-like protein
MTEMSDLALRKRMLVQRSAVQRHVLALQLDHALRPAVSVVHQARVAGQWVRAHPALVAGVAAALLVWRPKAVWGLLPRAWSLWQLWQRLRSAQA